MVNIGFNTLFEENKRVYVGSPLILEEFRETNLAELIGNVINQCGFNSYLPHLNTQHPDDSLKPDSWIYEKNMDEVIMSRFCVFEVSNPSHGVGMEIQKAREYNVPYLLLSTGKKRLSKMVKGTINSSEERFYFEYGDVEELEGLLKQFITDNFKGGN